MPTSAEKRALFDDSLRAAERHLARRDPRLRPIIKKHGPCLIRPHTRYFETLIDAIISQQLSVKAADTISGRFKALFAPAKFPKPEQILATPFDELRAVGLSGGKVGFIKDLAAHTADGRIKFNRVGRLTDEQIITMLTPVKGIGVWTVQMFLIFSLGRLDVLPVGDLGVRRGIQHLHGFDEMPTTAEMERIADESGWHPYCSVASWYLWRSWEGK